MDEQIQISKALYADLIKKSEKYDVLLDKITHLYFTKISKREFAYTNFIAELRHFFMDTINRTL